MEVISRTSSHYDPSLTYPNNLYGHGQIDAYRGLLDILGIDAIPGDGFTYNEKFVIIDAVYEPALSDISATAAEGLDISFAKTAMAIRRA